MKTITQTKGKTMKLDQVVQCPADRGELPYLGRITHISQAVQKNIHGVRFVWVTVRHSKEKRSAVWPSHRLGFRV